MLLEPPIDKLVKKIGNPYKLAALVGKQAKLYQQTLTEEQKEEKTEVTRAIEDVYNDKIIAVEE